MKQVDLSKLGLPDFPYDVFYENEQWILVSPARPGEALAVVHYAGISIADLRSRLINATYQASHVLKQISDELEAKEFVNDLLMETEADVNTQRFEFKYPKVGPE